MYMACKECNLENVHAMITKVKDKQFVFTYFKAICDEQEIDEFHTKLDAFLLWLNQNEFEELLWDWWKGR